MTQHLKLLELILVALPAQLSHLRAQVARAIRAVHCLDEVIKASQVFSHIPGKSQPVSFCPQRRLEPAEVDLLAAKYQDGATLVALAALFGIHKRTVAAHLERRGVSQRARGLQTEDVATAARLRSDGWTYARIATQFRVDVDTVRRALHAIISPI